MLLIPCFIIIVKEKNFLSLSLYDFKIIGVQLRHKSCSHGRHILCYILDIYTIYGVLFFTQKLLCKKLWGSLWGKLWGKISRKISRGNAA